MRFCYIIPFIGIFCSVLTGQESRISEDEIALQHQFIDAYKGLLTRDFDASIEALKTLHREDRDNGGILYELAKIYHQKEDFVEAENYIQKAINLEPANFWYYDFQANLFEETQKPSDAIFPLEKMRQFKPKDLEIAERLAFNHIQTGNLNAAIDIFNDLESTHGIQENFSRKKYDLFLSLDDYKKAVKELERLSNAYPNNVNYLNNLASGYVRIKNKKKAQKTYQKVLNIDPANPTATMALSGSLAKKGNESAYLSSLNVLITSNDISLDQKIKELIPFVEKVSAEDDDLLKSELSQTLEKLQNTHYSDAKVYAIYGDYYMNIGETIKAIKKYKKTLEINKSVFPVWEQLFYALDKEKDYPSLGKYSEEALDLYPNQGVGYYFNGLALNKMGKYQASVDILEEAMMLSRKNPQIQYLSLVTTANNLHFLGQNIEAKEKLSEAKTLFEKPHPFYRETEKLLDTNNDGSTTTEEYMHKGLKKKNEN